MATLGERVGGWIYDHSKYLPKFVQDWLDGREHGPMANEQHEQYLNKQGLKDMASDMHLAARVDVKPLEQSIGERIENWVYNHSPGVVKDWISPWPEAAHRQTMTEINERFGGDEAAWHRAQEAKDRSYQMLRDDGSAVARDVEWPDGRKETFEVATFVTASHEHFAVVNLSGDDAAVATRGPYETQREAMAYGKAALDDHIQKHIALYGRDEPHSQEPLKDWVAEEHRNERGELHRHPPDGPAQVIIRERHDWDFGEWEKRTEIFAVNGRVTARREVDAGNHEEGSWYREHNYDAQGRLHAGRNEAAVIVREDHSIPEETHLDEVRKEHWRHGVMVGWRDTTYDDIVQHKPLPVQQAFGWNVDDSMGLGSLPQRQTPDEQVAERLTQSRHAAELIKTIDRMEDKHPADQQNRQSLLNLIKENISQARDIRAEQRSLAQYYDSPDRGISR